VDFRLKAAAHGYVAVIERDVTAKIRDGVILRADMITSRGSAAWGPDATSSRPTTVTHNAVFLKHTRNPPGYESKK
jgi:predicted acyl esterase